MSAKIEFEKLTEYLESSHGAVAGQMFGKKCIKVNGKAAIALFNESLVFKLPDISHEHAMSLSGSILWDPSGKGRPMKEWVQVLLKHKSEFAGLSESSANYVG